MDVLGRGIKNALASDSVITQLDKIGSIPIYMDAAGFEARWLELENQARDLIPLAKQERK